MATECYDISSLTNKLNEFEARLKSCKKFFDDNYTIEKIKIELAKNLDTEININVENGNENINKIYNKINSWTDPNYKKIFGVYNCDAEGPDGPGTGGGAANFENLNCFEDDIDDEIKDNNELIKNIKDISGSRNEYNKFIDLLEKAQNTGDASEPRKKVRKQLLQNKNLLAFIYLSAILGGSYYIYRYLKK